jgi:hypothetical protein
MKRVLVIILLIALLTAGTIGCAPSRSSQQLAKIEAQLQTLTSALASTQQELASAKQALAEAQNKTNLLQQQPALAAATNSSVATTSFATSAVYTTAPTIASFTANPTVIMPGQSSTLQWNVTGADSVSIDPGVGNVPYIGARVVYPTASTTYILTATNNYSSVTAYATITIPEAYQTPLYPYYNDYPYYIPRYASPPVSPTPPPPPRPPRPRPPFTNNSTSPSFPFPHW